MPHFSDTSISRLHTCAYPLQRVFNEVIETFDCTIICGHRGEEAQNQAVKSGKSKVAWPDGKHNSVPSQAVDVAPYPIDWNDKARFYYFAGYVMGIADRLGVKLRWGGDWDQDTEVDDQMFNDLVHFELVE